MEAHGFLGASSVAKLLLVGVLVTFAGTASGSTVLPISIRQAVSHSGIIFAGTVQKIEYSKLPDVGIVTRITFRDLEYVTDPQSEPAVLTIRGGRRGSVVSTIVGLPPLDEGSRYVIFLRDWGSPRNSYVPVIGLDQGIYRVRNEGDDTVISDSRNRILVGVREGILGVMDPTFGADAKTKATARRDSIEPGGMIVESMEMYWPDSVFTTSHVARDQDGMPSLRIYPPRVDPGTRMSEVDFLAFLRDLRKGN